MNLGVRGRIFLAIVVLAIVVGLPAGVLLEVRLRASQLDRVERSLARDAAALRVQLETLADPLDSTEADATVDALAEALEVRLTLIAADGRVIADSDLDGAALAGVDNHADRPEVIDAMRTGKGLSRRFSDTVRDDLLYVAARGELGGETVTFRAATPLRGLSAMVWQLRVTLLLGGALALVLAAASGGLMSWWIQATLGRLVDRAQALQGDRSDTSDDGPDDHEPDNDDLATPTGEVARSAAPRPSMRELTGKLDQVVHDLAQERDRLGAVLDAVTDGVIAVDAALRITAANPPARGMMGRKRVIGRRLAKLTPSPELVTLADAARSGDQALEAEVDWGEPPREHHVTAAPIPSLGGCVLVIHDLTEVRALERVRSDFVANVSHELRTPISIIAATTETLMDGAVNDPDAAREFAGALHRHATRVGGLVQDLLSLSRIEAGQFPLAPQVLDVRAAVDRVAQAAMERSPERERPIEIDIPDGVRVWADHAGLDHLLGNLVENAVAYSDVDDRVLVRARTTKKWIVIEVVDEGPGIADEHRERVFERFYRVDTGRSRDAGGTGLGLSIVRHMAGLMQGTVELSANEPRGCVFTLKLPRPADPA